ncbi:hypothetical protein ACFCYB_36440 [Streptomyces sp. NPDC056309]
MRSEETLAGRVRQFVMSQLYEVAEDWELPPEARGVEATGTGGDHVTG